MAAIWSMACSRVICSLAARCRSEVERKVWMRPRAAGSMERAAASMSSRLQRAREAMMGARSADFAGDEADGFGVALGGDGEAGLEDVDAEGGDLVGEAQFFAAVHGAAGRLLAVAQGGVEEEDAGFLRALVRDDGGFVSRT